MIILSYQVTGEKPIDYVALDGKIVRYKTGRAENAITRMATSLDMTPEDFVREIEKGWSNGYVSLEPVEVDQKEEQTVAAAALQDWVEHQRMAHGS